MEQNQHHLYIACEACKGNFVVPILISFLKLFKEMNWFIFTGTIFQFSGP